MKVQLYAVCLGTTWKWQLSIHTKTDIHYWFEHYAADAGLVLFEPFISLGQGVRLLQSLRKEKLFAVENVEVKAENMLKRLRTHAYESGITLSKTLDMSIISYESWKHARPMLMLEAGVYNSIVEACSGRSLLVEEICQVLEGIGVNCEVEDVWLSYLQLAHLNGDLEWGAGLKIVDSREWRQWFKKGVIYRCNRCGSGNERMFWSSCIHCGQECPYCEECLAMGRVRFCSLLVSGRSSIETRVVVSEDLCAYIEPWGLSRPQARASLEGLQYISGAGAKVQERGARGFVDTKPLAPRKFLIWAVTGAGKTEMIFPFIHYTVAKGGRVLIATPRKDVVLELQPRITQAFTGYSVVTLYGGSEQRWEQGQITIATTHQLLRFHEAFDLVVIDEIDAFPYHNNPMLAYAASKVCKPSGINILLSATPPKAIRQAAERGQLPHVRVPVRYHRHPLPVPQLISVPSLRKSQQTQSIPKTLSNKIEVSIDRGAQVFIFVPNIQLVEPVVELLRSLWKSTTSICIEGTSSKDPSRSDKVQRFRNREIRLLVTTTILERGVTVPKSDVFILDADSRLFDEAALVQMAGRAGRSKDDPAGMVYFAAKEMTQAQKEAIRQIRHMNRIASKQGYLVGG
ncbi:DEAD/DEAH box helicase [Paenibacillus sp. HWE-109]|uniref:DEAD/DEAH box helicase n=1 Tax=Paenibacillus sp. HWE-109 TaxID=1306526 RepID=UPI001EDCFF28|nr:helicase-related protein [Paenibacillus sp. HWE-109]UKS26127.1 DEAD/DEAH box helicase [Paenibacillus sp. HWE-109]